MRISALVAALFLAWAPFATAQDWITPEYCDLTDTQIDFSSFPGLKKTSLEQSASLIPNANGKLWRITHSSGATSHLWGTFHANDPNALRLPETAVQLIQNAQVVALEFDPVFPTRQSFKRSMDSGAYFSDMDSNGLFQTNRLREIIDPVQMAHISDRLDAIGWGAETADYLRPSVLAEILLNNPCNDFAEGSYPTQDSLIQLTGELSGARILGLEDPRAFRTKLEDPTNRALTFNIIQLYAQALNPNFTAAQQRTFFALYQQGRIGLAMALDKALTQQTFGDKRGETIQKSVDDYLLTERNMEFANAVQSEIEQGDVFVAIGAWHLPGTGGMIELLRKRGFHVSRVHLPDEVWD
ncbi:TraB/GumN family protein [Sulfitobacter mediterraneus]|uniref:TraB/GumN family protein n=1 Tax=Sulfitobacter mediterraneus TaxID=83219 RepID=UPI0021A2968C|nr:TraB/GumN family protein [Sulfitobacter mediterraneus]UWR11765.1 TraB/GumN family protein [Sulfitobacter mediterraneus]